ncbi:hypothetical protein O6H91_08G052700 [Diphasiastrum complanatum]|uniref:Uncharacterized protein n=1 Tax=Diphasiastrum complanatum TaxID=34168 RepID=A0ACC2CXY8_DIPCM|nr:hypothetical protein O6H91_08G052700 [Diphasiastrum complanatum]
MGWPTFYFHLESVPPPSTLYLTPSLDPSPILLLFMNFVEKMADVHGSVEEAHKSLKSSADTSLLQEIREKQSLLTFAMVAIFELALTLQILYADNLSKESGFYTVILCTSSVGVTLSAVIVIDVFRRIHADVPASVKLCFYVTLLYFCVLFVMNVTASNSRRFYVIPSIYVIVAFSIIVHFTLPNIAKAINSRMVDYDVK